MYVPVHQVCLLRSTPAWFWSQLTLLLLISVTFICKISLGSFLNLFHHFSSLVHFTYIFNIYIFILILNLLLYVCCKIKVFLVFGVWYIIFFPTALGWLPLWRNFCLLLPVPCTIYMVLTREYFTLKSHFSFSLSSASHKGQLEGMGFSSLLLLEPRPGEAAFPEVPIFILYCVYPLNMLLFRHPRWNAQGSEEEGVLSFLLTLQAP